MAHLAIVGGGISGLTAAYRFSKSVSDGTVSLFERDSRLGGKLRTRAVDGFLFEDGPDSFLTYKPAGVELCRELGIEDRIISRTKRSVGSFIYHGGRLHPLPEGFSGLVPTAPSSLARSGLLTESGLRRLRSEGEVPAASPDTGEESIAEFLTRRFGSEAFEVMIEPLVSGIFAGDARRLSVDAAFPQLVERERRNGSLSAPPIDGKRGATVRPGASSLPPFVSFRGGMDELSRALRTKIDPRCVHVGSEVVTISRRGRGYRLGLSDGSRIEADAVVAAVPPQVVARVFAALDPGLAEAHGAVASASTVVVNLGYRTPDLPAPLDGYGYLTPMIEGRLFHGCTWSSNKWLGRAPEGHTAIRLYGGRFGEDALFRSNDEEILRAAKREPAETMGLPAEPVVTRITRWADAIPQYNLGYRSILRRIEESLAELPGVFLAGAVYAGVGIPDCIRSGNKAAADAVRYLYGRERR